MSACRYLMIENPGASSADLLTVIGASTSRHQDELIGQFGSGFKYSIALLLRNNIKIKLFLGKQGYEFGSSPTIQKDVCGYDAYINEVYMRGFVGATKAKKMLGFDKTFGEMDWQDPTMALREFVSNAVDASVKVQGNFSGCQLFYKDEKEVKGEEDTTRIFVEMTSEIENWDLRKHFMLFDDDYDPKEHIIPKLVAKGNLRVYRKGVLVGELPYPSLFDYNLSDISLKECRIITTEDARCGIALALKGAEQEHVETWLEAIRDEKNVFEIMEVSTNELFSHSWDKNRQKKQETWKKAYHAVFGDKGIVCDTRVAEEMVEKKGYNPVVVKPEMKNVLKSFGIRTSSDVLDHFEASGRQKIDLSPEQIQKMQDIWNLLEELGVTAGREIPTLEGFHTLMNASSLTFAYYDFARDTVGMSGDVINDAGHLFPTCAIEEYAHSITKSADFTRDMQDFGMRVAGMLIHRELERRKSV